MRMQEQKTSSGDTYQLNVASDQENANNILYVDDEEIHLKIFKLTFGKQYNVFTAGSGIEALEILKKENIHLIITDQRMPEMTGTELLEKTKELNSDIVKIILTGYSDVNTIERAVNNCGIYKYMVKPYDNGQMKLTLDKGLELIKLKIEKEKLLNILRDTNHHLEEKVAARTKKLSEVNDKLVSGLEYAKNIQEHLLPSSDIFHQCFNESYVLYHPLDYVGGDFYYLDQIQDRHGKITLLSVFDCMGHGVSGALLTMVGESNLSQIIYDSRIYHPDFVLEAMHENLLNVINTNLPEQEYQTIDLSFVVINHNKRTLEFSGAMMDLVYINKEGKQVRLKGERKSLGSTVYNERVSFQRHYVNLDDVDSLYLSSDGFKDQMKIMGNRLPKNERRMSDLIDNLHAMPFGEQGTVLEEKLNDWFEQENQLDDITLIGIKF